MPSWEGCAVDGPVEGEEVSDDCCEGAEEENNLAISALPCFLGAAVVDEDVTSVEDEDVTFEDVKVDEETGRVWSFEDPAVETGLLLT